MFSQDKSTQNRQIDHGFGIIDSLNSTATYTLFLTETLRRLLEETAKVILFPTTAAISIIKSALAWRQVSLDKGANGSIIRAVIETLSAIAVTVAVVGGLVAASIFATISPLIFSTLLASKTIYNIAGAAYYYGKSVASSDHEQRELNKKISRNYLVGALALTFATIAVTAVMIFLKPLMAIFGITAGIIGLGFNLYHLANTFKTQSNVSYQALKSQEETNDVSKDLTINAKMTLALTNASNRPHMTLSSSNEPLHHSNIFQKEKNQKNNLTPQKDRDAREILRLG